MKYFYERNLPHYVVDGYAYFITFRTVNSLSRGIIEKLNQSYQEKLSSIQHIKDFREKRRRIEEIRWNYFVEFDAYLDSNISKNDWLRHEKTAKLVSDSMHYRDEKFYDLFAYTVMPNHVHLVIFPYFSIITKQSDFNKEYPLGGVMSSLKKYTALRANNLLSRQGVFWQHENYDHIVRDSEDLHRIVKYVLNNPVKAKLVEISEQYSWSYYNPEHIPW